MLTNILNKLVFTGERASLRDIDGINLARYNFALKYSKGKTLIEFGCGSGYGANYLAGKGVDNIIAYDAEKRATDFAILTYKLPNIQFICKKIEDIDDNYKYDVALNFEVIEHLKDPDIFLKLVKKKLKRNGIFVISTPNRVFSSYDGDKPTNPYHVKEYMLNEFKLLLQKYFKTVKVYGIFLKTAKKTKEDTVKSNLRWRIAFILSHKRWIRRILNYMPEYPKRLFTGEININYSKDDFVFRKAKPEEAEYLIAICK